MIGTFTEDGHRRGAHTPPDPVTTRDTFDTDDALNRLAATFAQLKYRPTWIPSPPRT